MLSQRGSQPIAETNRALYEPQRIGYEKDRYKFGLLEAGTTHTSHRAPETVYWPVKERYKHPTVEKSLEP